MSSPPTLIVSAFVPFQTSALLEWVAYHRLIGASRIHLFLSHRRRGEPALANALAKAGIVETSHVPFDHELPEEPRNAALRAAEVEAEASGGYGLFLEVDEYFRIESGAKSIPSLMRSLGGADVMTVPVAATAMGTSPEHNPGPVLARSGPCQPPAQAADLFHPNLRSVVRLGLFGSRTPNIPTGPFLHPPSGSSGIKWINGSGAPMPEPHSAVAWRDTPSAVGTDKAKIIKIAAPSLETYLLRLSMMHRTFRPTRDEICQSFSSLAASAEPDRGFAHLQTELDAEIAAIMAMPGVTDAQNEICKAEMEMLDSLKREDELFRSTYEAWTGRALPAEAPPAKTPSKTTDKPKKTDPPNPEEENNAPPPWFTEIYPGGERQGFYTRFANHAVLCIERSPSTLVVSFDNLSTVNDLSYAREPWAYKFIHDCGYSHLSVMARRKDWFRDAELIDYLKGLATSGYFRKFEKVFMTGTSMGGFASLAFASLAPGCTVISFSPQTTLDEALVPWERRFGMGRRRDWSLPFSDCAYEIDDIKKAFVFYDPFFEPDRRHVERLEGDNVHLLKTWCSGHFSPVFLRRADLLKPVMKSAFEETLTPSVFYALYRERRKLPWYRKSLIGYLEERGHNALAARVTPAFRALRLQAAE